MITNLFQAIVCPTGNEPTKDNTTSHTVIATDFTNAISVLNEHPFFRERDLVSLSYIGEAYGHGTIVDFE